MREYGMNVSDLVSVMGVSQATGYNWVNETIGTVPTRGDAVVLVRLHLMSRSPSSKKRAATILLQARKTAPFRGQPAANAIGPALFNDGIGFLITHLFDRANSD